MTEEQREHDWTPELIRTALTKVDDLIKSTNQLAISNAELQLTMREFKVRWQDVREEVSRDRHDAKNKFIVIDERLKYLEEDKKLNKELQEAEDKRKKKQFNRVYAIITLITGVVGLLHWKNIKDLLTSIL